jgi:two-component system, OmpR family, phosphate regulon sensor histidine kinase PhoR
MALMVVTLLVITGFQVYWLRDNYHREKRALEIKMNVVFQETVRDLQVEKLQLSANGQADTPRQKLQVVVANNSSTEKKVDIKMLKGNEVITMVNTIRRKVLDSTIFPEGTKRKMVISVDQNRLLTDTLITNLPGGNGSGNRVFSFLYGVDSLQDSLKIADIKNNYQKALDQEKLPVPFSVQRLKEGGTTPEPDLAQVTVGFAKPITYRLDIGNASTYLLSKITMPILFSLFLIGTVLLSFWLVYRTILKQQRLAFIKNEFISNITHELKTPIATVAVAIEALKNFNAIDDAQKTREYLDISSNELQRLSLLVDKVLKLSMLEKKETDLTLEDISLQQVVEEVVISMRLQFEKINAVVNIHTEGNTRLQADRLHLLSVVYNLLDNAIKYRSEKPVIDIVIKEKGEHLELTIKDNGPGIPAEYKDRIFEKFFRVPSGDTHNARGYGLGLCYVQHIIEQHKGNIQLETAEGKGSQFIIHLPIQHGH